MNQINIDPNSIRTMIPGGNPCGEDMSFSSEFDLIQEARRQDDPDLEQGEWITSLKEADWKQVTKVCQDLLLHRTKDLRLASWLTEALAKLHGIEGLKIGFEVMAVLTDEFWEQLYPDMEDGDPEQRIGNIAWLLGRSQQLIREFPVNDHKGLRHTLLDLEGARALQSQLERNSEAAETQTDRISLQQIREAQLRTPSSFYLQQLEGSRQCIAALRLLAAAVDRHLGLDGPSFSPLIDELEGYAAELSRLANENGVNAGASEVPTHQPGDPAISGIEPAPSFSNQLGAPTNRTQALRQLREVAAFFRRTEPHSPVAYLAEKAARWGEMPLHIWLKTVLKEDGALARFEDILDFDESSQN